uniref:Uncharacterized protein n=1 Tax=Brassica oleracea TaxID=3712 RepID=Q2A9Q4_BRAOL|nr:hypothetical protein 26.t00009 [Brassica oleracea]
MRKRPLKFIIAYERSKDKKKATEKTFRKFRRLPDDFTGSPDDFTGSPDDFTGSPDDFTGSPDDFVRRLPRSPDDFQTTSRRLPDDFQTTNRLRQKTSMKFRRLPGSLDDFTEVQTTSWKSRRLPGSPDDFVRRLPRSRDDFQTTSRRLTGKSSKKSSRSEKSAYQIQI